MEFRHGLCLQNSVDTRYVFSGGSKFCHIGIGSWNCLGIGSSAVLTKSINTS